MTRHTSFETFKQRFKDIGKPKTVDLDFLSAKGFCHAAIAKYDQKKFGTGSPTNNIVRMVEDKITKKYPNIIPSFKTTAGGSFSAGIAYFVNKELGIDFDKRTAKAKLIRRDSKDQFGDIDQNDQTVWEKDLLSGSLIPRQQYKFTSEEVTQAIKEAIIKYGTEYAATHSRLAQAQKQIAPLGTSEDSRSLLRSDTDSEVSDQDNESLPSPSPSQKSFDSGVSDTNSTLLDIDKEEDKSRFTP